MKLIWKGHMREDNIIIYQNMPADAKKLFPMRGAWIMYLLIIPILLFAYIGIRVRLLYSTGIMFSRVELLVGVLVSLLFLPVHELLHAVCCPRHSACFMYLTSAGLCVVPACPLRKKRYIFMAIMPTIILGICPFLAWMLFPNMSVCISSILVGFSVGSLSMSIGDIYNVILALCKMRSQSVLITSGRECYYYEEK